MHLTFTPALNDIARLTTPGSLHGRGQAAPAQTLVFKVAFDSRASVEQAKKDGIRVEMWTDLPVEGRSGWEWGALPFQELQDPPAQAVGRDVLSLLSPEEQADDRADGCALYAKLPVNLHEYAPGHQFSFTYRLVYPSGAVRWLGEYGRNGVLVVEWKPFPAASGVRLGEGWAVGGDKAERAVSGPGEHEVGKLNRDLRWSTWALGENSGPVFSSSVETPPSSAICMFPHARTHGIITPRPLILCATHGSTVHIDPNGTVKSAGEGVLSLGRIDGTPLEGSPWSSFISSPANQEPPCLVLSAPSSVKGSHMSLLFLPLAEPVEQEVFIDKHRLAALLPSAVSDHFVLSSPATEQFISPTDERVAIRVGRFGGRATLAPVYRLNATDGDSKGSWGICILDPHTSVTVTEESHEPAQRVLPTPPPSPPPVVRAVTSRAAPLPLPSFSEISEQFTSFTSSEASSPAASPFIPHAPIESPSPGVAESLTPYASPATNAYRQYMNIDRDRLALARVQSTRALQAYMGIMLAMFAMLWQVLLQRVSLLWGEFVGGQIMPSRSVIVMERSEMGEHADADDVSMNSQEAPTPVREETSLTDENDENPGGTSGGSVESDCDDSYDVAIPHAFALSPTASVEQLSFFAEPKEHQALSQLVRRPASLSANVQVTERKLSLLVHTSASTLPLRVVLDDEHVLDPEIKSTGHEGVYVMNLYPPAGFERSSKLTVSLS